MLPPILEKLKNGFNDHVAFHEKRPGIVQVMAPFYHEDGDMVDLFIDFPSVSDRPLVITDHGLTLMRLSYTYDVETSSKQKILERILSENGVTLARGRMFLETSPESLYPSILQFAQTVAKVCNMQMFNQAVVQNLFYELLDDFVKTSLSGYSPIEKHVPIADREDLEVDWCFPVSPKDIFLFGVRGSAKARLAALTCLDFQRNKTRFRSVAVHFDFENDLSKKDRSRITNAVDKQFASLADFKSGAEEFFSREAIVTSVQ